MYNHQANVEREGQSRIFVTLMSLVDGNRQLGADMAEDLAQLRHEIKRSVAELTEYIKKLDFRTRSLSGSYLKSSDGRNEIYHEAPQDAIERLVTLADTGSKIARQQRLLGQLRFRWMKDRHSNVADAHPNTFHWIFEESAAKRQSAVDFAGWLRSDDPIYWISGKPGSGKSTLMKYLIGEKDTLGILENWAYPNKLIVASFFFWVAGTPLQKSQEGLLRSLLYEILRKCPDLIHLCFRSRWDQSEEWYREPGLWTGFGMDEAHTWTRSELLEAFAQLRQHSLSSVRYCFFIDGLDEYDGQHSELVELIIGLLDTRSIKFCLSSRPWNVFESAFNGKDVRKVYLEDLNKPDIELFVKNKLVDRADFVRYQKRDSRCNAITKEVVEKAQGVFLWVFLVVRSLAEGLDNADRFIDLQRRLRSFPADLDAYFRHILFSLDPIYREQTAHAFQVSLYTVRPLSLLNHWFLDREEEYGGFAIEMGIELMSRDERKSRNAEMRQRLNGRCKGLLEVKSNDEVSFLHRTVKDFLLAEDMQRLLAAWAHGQFDVNLAICKSRLAEIKSVDIEGIGHSIFMEMTEAIFHHAREIEIRTGHTPMALLDSLDHTVQNIGQNRFAPSWDWERRPDWELHSSFLTSAIVKELKIYVKEKLDQDPSLLHKKKGIPLLAYALSPSRTPFVLNLPPRLEMVQELLGRGADPNQPWAGSTVWKCFLLSLIRNSRKPTFPRDLCYECIRLLLLHNADLNTKLGSRANSGDTYVVEKQKSSEAESAFEIIQQIFSKQEAAELSAIASSKGSLRTTRWFKFW